MSSLDPETLNGCPVQTTLTLISNKWKIFILRDLLSEGPLRFNELKRSVGNITQKVLTSQLRSMEADGLITRTAYPEIPPRVVYELTDLGHSLKPVLDSMRNWGEGYKIEHVQDSQAPEQTTAHTLV